MSILQIAIKDYLGDFSVDFVPEYLMQTDWELRSVIQGFQMKCY